MKYRITHLTTYSGTEPISVGHNQAWLRPRDLPGQSCDAFRLQISPEPSVLSLREDSFGNKVATFSFNEGYSLLKVEAQSSVTVKPGLESLPVTEPWENVVEQVQRHACEEDFQALQFIYDSPLAPAFLAARAYGEVSFVAGRPIGEAAADLMSRIKQEFLFDPHATTVSTPVTQVLDQKKGVCQDFAHVMISILRSLGVAARYVSGYIRTYPKPGQPRLVGADASHAWVGVYCGPAIGWLDFDPTNDLLVGDEHITVAWGRDYSDIPPLRGVFIGGGQPHLHVSVDVEPVDGPAT
jgi:transglutaminase-like putative cysteine protease